MVVWLCLMGCLLFVVGHAPPAAAEDGYLAESPRLTVDVVGGMFADYPNSTEDPGGGVAGRYSFWSARNSWIGVDASVAGLAGMAQSMTVHSGASVAMGGTVFVFDWLAFEIDLGPYAGAQIGDGFVPVVGMFGAGAYRFQFGAHTVRLALSMMPATAIADDPGNDCGMCDGFLGLGLGYDFRF